MLPRTAFRSALLLSTSIFWLAAASPSLEAQGYLDEWAYTSYADDLPGANYVDFDVGTLHVVALRHDGFLVSSGWHADPQITDTPTDGGYSQVAAGYAHSLALRLDGTIAAWGISNGSQYDYGQVTNAPTGAGFVQVDCGEVMSLALRADGSVVAWGADDWGHVSNAPTEMGFVQISCGGSQAMALRADGSIVSWGGDWNGLVSGTPTELGFVQVEAAQNSSFALRADGTIAAWGDNAFTTINAPADAGYALIGSGYSGHAMALRADGSIHSWGTNDGELLSMTPAGTGYSKIAGGYEFALALKGDRSGAPFCVGDGSGSLCPCFNHGQLDEGCANSTGSHGARLVGAGDPALATDTFRLEVENLPTATLGVILRASGQFNAGLGNPAGDGLFCVGGQVVRSQVQLSSGGVSTFTDFNGSPFGLSSQGAGERTNYQYFYRDAANPCSGSGFNFSNAWTVIWAP